MNNTDPDFFNLGAKVPKHICDEVNKEGDNIRKWSDLWNKWRPLAIALTPLAVIGALSVIGLGTVAGVTVYERAYESRKVGRETVIKERASFASLEQKLNDIKFLDGLAHPIANTLVFGLSNIGYPLELSYNPATMSPGFYKVPLIAELSSKKSYTQEVINEYRIVMPRFRELDYLNFQYPKENSAKLENGINSMIFKGLSKDYSQLFMNTNIARKTLLKVRKKMYAHMGTSAEEFHAICKFYDMIYHKNQENKAMLSSTQTPIKKN